jgi:hypothetical protein
LATLLFRAFADTMVAARIFRTSNRWCAPILINVVADLAANSLQANKPGVSIERLYRRVSLFQLAY